MWKSFVAIFRKEVLHIQRDRSVLFISLAIPLFQLLLFGFIDQIARDLPTVVVDGDHSRYSREFMDKLRATRTFKITHVTSDQRVARADIVAGRASVGIVIPPDFHNDLARGETGEVLVLIDGSDATVSSQALAAINGIAAKANLEKLSRVIGGHEPPPEQYAVHPTILFNPDGRTANYIIPGLAAILIQILITTLCSISIVRERETGTFEQLLVTPVHPVGLMLGKVAPYMFFGLAEMAMILGVMRWGFSVPIRGNLIFLFVMGIIYICALLALGLYVSTRAKSQAQAQQMAQFFFLPSVFLSGYIFPTSSLPVVLKVIGRLLPATHMIEIMRGVVLRDAGPLDLLPNVLALIGLSASLVWLSLRGFHKAAL